MTVRTYAWLYTNVIRITRGGPDNACLIHGSDTSQLDQIKK